MSELYKSKEWLYDQYWNKENSISDLAKICNRGKSTIRYWLKKFQIKKRENSEAQKKAHIKKNYGFKKGNIPINPFKKGHQWRFKKGNKIGEEFRFINTKEEYNRKEYDKIHYYIRKCKQKPNKCQICKEDNKLELSFDHSLGDYTFNIENYKYLCKKCHFNRDKKLGSYIRRNEVDISLEIL